MCGYHLINELDEKNCLDLLLLADKYSEANLRKAAMEFVVKNIKTLMQTDQWIEMKNNYADLIIEVHENEMEERNN